MDDFKPDICHFFRDIRDSEMAEAGCSECKIIYTAHDYQLICPNHMMNNMETHENCENCIDGHFINCTKGKCIHKSIAKSAVGTAEAYFWKWQGIYKYIDKIICCSEFIKTKLDRNPVFAGKTVALHNFIDMISAERAEKKDYVLYFGRFSQEKGINTLIKAAKALPEIDFIFARAEECAGQIEAVPNIKNVGFQSGENLMNLIREARFSICPFEWYENCPFSVVESQMCGTPVIGARIGGIPELIKEGITGELFKSGDIEKLKEKIFLLWNDKTKAEKYSENCTKMKFDNVKDYCDKIMEIYKGNPILQ